MGFIKLSVRLGSQLITDGLSTNRRMAFLYNGMSKCFDCLQNRLMNLYSTSSENRSDKYFSVAVEGNIGSGKTFLLQHFSHFPDVEVYMEPVSKWQNIDGHNALEMLYKDPSRWALTFQTYVQLTMVEQHLHKPAQAVKIMERSIYSAKYCFVENLYRSGVMPELEYLVLTKWFDWLIHNQDMHLDLIVYLRTSPETVFQRIKQRCRGEEKSISLEYLTSLHNLHEDWLINRTKFTVGCPILVLDANQDITGMLKQYEAYKRQILRAHS